ncbi:MAG: hypothetical protein RLZZ58_1236 [Pseudomonadota bacterium]
MTDTAFTTERPGQKLGLFAAVALVMGNVIGSGAFLLPAQLAPFGWNAVIAWAVTIGGALCLANAIAQLTARHPGIGGPIGMVRVSFGPFAASIAGFGSWVSFLTANATLAVAATSYGGSQFPWLLAHPALASILLVWILTAVALASTRLASVVQSVTMLLKLVPLLIALALIIAIIARPGPAPVPPFVWADINITAVGAAAALALWAMVGFEAASLAEDIVDQPVRNIPRATLFGAGLSGLFYLVVCSGVMLLIPAAEMAASNAPFALFIGTYWGPQLASIIGIFAAIAAMGALNGWILLHGELPRSLAVRGLFPAFFGRVTARRTPYAALITGSVITTLLLAANSSKDTAALFAFMALLSTSCSLWIYLACSIAAIRLRAAMITSAVGVAFAVWALWGAGITPSALSFALMMAGAPLYWIARREGPLAPLGREPAAIS